MWLTILAVHATATAGWSAVYAPGDTTAVAAAHAIEGLINDVLDAEALEDVDLAVDMAGLRVDLNRARREDLAAVPGLSTMAIDAILRLRRESGRIESMDVLDTLSTLSEVDRALLRAFAQISPSVRQRRRMRATMSARIGRRLERSSGFVDHDDGRPFAGGPTRMVHRFTVRHRAFSAALSADKPAGTAVSWDADRRHYGFDVVKGYAHLQPVARLGITVGDYRIEQGQGLTMWSGTVMGRGRETVRSVERGARGVRGTATTMDDRVLRGIAIGARLHGGVKADLFVSRRALDAQIDTTYVDGIMDVKARRSSSPAHRTALELSRRKQLRETVVGGAIEAEGRGVRVGIVGYEARYDVPLAAGDRPDTFFHPGGDRIVNAGAYASVRWGGVSIFGEASLDSASPSYVIGSTLSRGRDFETVLLLRNLRHDAYRPFSAGFASRSAPLANEHGAYWGLRMMLGPGLELRAFADLVRHPWLRYLQPAPTAGSDYFVDLTYRPRDWWEGSVSARRRSVEGRFVPDGSVVAAMDRRPLHMLRIDTRLRPGGELELRARTEVRRRPHADGSTTHGYLIYQEVHHQWPRGMTWAARYAHFDVENAEVSVYAYERDVHGAFSSHMFTGRGRRAYVLATYRPRPGASVQARISRTWLDGVQSIGSGHDRISGNTLTDVRLQLTISK